MQVRMGRRCWVALVLVVFIVTVTGEITGPEIGPEIKELKDGPVMSGVMQGEDGQGESVIKDQVVAGKTSGSNGSPASFVLDSIPPSGMHLHETLVNQNKETEVAQEESLEPKLPDESNLPHQSMEPSATEKNDASTQTQQDELNPENESSVADGPQELDSAPQDESSDDSSPTSTSVEFGPSQSPQDSDQKQVPDELLSAPKQEDPILEESSSIDTPEVFGPAPNPDAPILSHQPEESSFSSNPEELSQPQIAAEASIVAGQEDLGPSNIPNESIPSEIADDLTISHTPDESGHFHPHGETHQNELHEESSENREESISPLLNEDQSHSHQHEESIETESTEESPTPTQQSDHDGHTHENGDHSHHHHHHHHLHRHNHDFWKVTNETSSIVIVIKHLSSTLLSFLPEPLQDTILDVDDALVLTGIIALTLVSICVPYFLIEGYMSVRPLKKKVVELNKSLWKVSAAYETQQEEFEQYKQKAIAHDDFKKRAEQSENDVIILKKLETKHREQITALKTQLKSQMKEAADIRVLIEKSLADKKSVSEECAKYKNGYETTKEALTKAREELVNYQTHVKSTALQLGVSSKNAGVLSSKISILEEEAEEIKSQLVAECEKRKSVEKEKREVEEAKVSIEKELTEIKNICHQYEETVTGLNDEISKLESELVSIKESLGEDSPLLEVAEIQAKAAFSEKEVESLRTRLDGLTSDNDNLRGKLSQTKSELETARNEQETTNNRLSVLEAYFKEREEEYIKTIDQLQLKESVRDKGKEELIRIIEEKENVCKDLNERLEALKDEFEETKQQHRNELRALEAKSHENWLSLCQAERKAQDARKEGEVLRQRLLAMQKEKDEDDGDGLNGEVPMFPVIPHELVPLPLMDEPPSYFGLGDFVPPPPLPEGEEREPHRPPPLGGRISPSFSDDDHILSPIRRREDDCTDGSSGSESPRRSPFRGGWVNVQNDRGGPGIENVRRLARATSSPIQPGANL